MRGWNGRACADWLTHRTPCTSTSLHANGLPRGFVTEINAFGYESLHASYKGGEAWRQGMLKVQTGLGGDAGM